MTQEHKFEKYRLFYDEGTPHIWEVDVNETRFYSDSLKLQATLKFYPKFVRPYILDLYRIGKDGRRIHRKTWEFDDITKTVEILDTFPKIISFNEAIKEFTTVPE